MFISQDVNPSKMCSLDIIAYGYLKKISINFEKTNLVTIKLML